MTVPASADLQYTLAIDSDFSTGHNFGTVTLQTVSSTEVRVIVQLNTSIAGMGFANSGAGYAIAFDLSGGVPNAVGGIAFDATNTNNSDYIIQGLNGSYSAAPFTSGAHGNDFNYAIDYNAANGTDSKLVFDVNRASGIVLTDFVGNPNYRFAVDIITTAGATRNVATNNDSHNVPEPETWMLFFAGLAGLTALNVVQRRRKQARAA